MGMKRVLCLYRVSTKGQVDRITDDIPMQRRECMDFIARMDDWTFYDERVEKGVSGYKVSAENRDAILDIRALAEKKKFDVLLVFMFDRLGRREDETPFLVEWFIDHGIEVWSTREGQQKIESRSDKLINYIRFWQAGGESEKTSMRVKAAHTQMTSDGLWRGGIAPYGYKLVLNGQLVESEPPQDPVFLSNLREDPGETRNLAAQYPALTEELTQKALTWRAGIEKTWDEKFAANYRSTT